MDVKDAIDQRHAYRSFEPTQITDELIRELASAAQLAPSCFNNQPWRFVFAYDDETLAKLHESLSKGNQWAKAASLVIAVYSRKEDDCIIADRVYNMFDTGMACAFMMLRATELGLVAHPIAGYDPKKVAETLGIPTEYQVIALILVGRHSTKPAETLTEKQRENEQNRPPRHPLERISFKNSVPKTQ